MVLFFDLHTLRCLALCFWEVVQWLQLYLFFPPFFIANFCLFFQKGKFLVLTALPFCLFVFVSILFLLCWESLSFLWIWRQYISSLHICISTTMSLPPHPSAPGGSSMPGHSGRRGNKLYRAGATQPVVEMPPSQQPPGVELPMQQPPVAIALPPPPLTLPPPPPPRGTSWACCPRCCCRCAVIGIGVNVLIVALCHRRHFCRHRCFGLPLFS
jgi:hypothetical protein